MAVDGDYAAFFAELVSAARTAGGGGAAKDLSLGLCK
jgi:hypothetical protein